MANHLGDSKDTAKLNRTVPLEIGLSESKGITPEKSRYSLPLLPRINQSHFGKSYKQL